MTDTPESLLERLYAEHDAALLRYARRLVRDGERAREFVQDGWRSAWEHLPAQLERDAGAGTQTQWQSWLYAIVRNKCLDYVRSFKATERRLDDALLATLPPDTLTPEWVAVAGDALQQRAALAAILLEGVPRPYRTLLWLREYARFSHDALSWWTGHPVIAVKSRLYRARAYLDVLARNEARAHAAGGGIIVRLWEKIDQRAPDECWGWFAGGYATPHGLRPRIGVGTYNHNRGLDARRVLYLHCRGPLPLGAVLSQSCGDISCLNPRHLLPAYHGRVARYVEIRPAPTWEDLTALRIALPDELRVRWHALGVSQFVLADAAGLAQSTISEALSGRCRALPVYARVGEALTRLERQRHLFPDSGGPKSVVAALGPASVAAAPLR